MPFNISDYFNADGTFTDAKSQIPALLGEGYADTKVLDDVPDFLTFVKAHVDTKKMVGQRLENVIQKPKTDAGDAEKAAYRQTLLTELGAVKSADEYAFPKPELPDGLEYDEATDRFYAEMFAKIGMPKDMAAAIRQGFIDQAIAGHNAKVEAENKAFETAVEQFNTANPGEKAVATARLAHDLLMKIGSDDIKQADGTVIKGLKTVLKEAQLYDNPTDFKRWKDAGVNIDQIEMLAKLAADTTGGRMLTGGPGGEADQAAAANTNFINQVNAGSPGFKVEAGQTG